jgi:predicted RNA binding protein YcfA (HicA-like mRNA interferase family)
MPKLPRVTPRKLIAALLREGFVHDRQRGSHVMIRHPDGRRTIIPMHTRDLPIGTLRGILHDVDWSVEKLMEQLSSLWRRIIPSQLSSACSMGSVRDDVMR